MASGDVVKDSQMLDLGAARTMVMEGAGLGADGKGSAERTQLMTVHGRTKTPSALLLQGQLVCGPNHDHMRRDHYLGWVNG